MSIKNNVFCDLFFVKVDLNDVEMFVIRKKKEKEWE